MSASQNTVRDSVELFKMGSTFTTFKKVGSYIALGALGWAFAGANQAHFLPDLAATVLVAVVFIKML